METKNAEPTLSTLVSKLKQREFLSSPNDEIKEWVLLWYVSQHVLKHFLQQT